MALFVPSLVGDVTWLPCHFSMQFAIYVLEERPLPLVMAERQTPLIVTTHSCRVSGSMPMDFKSRSGPSVYIDEVTQQAAGLVPILPVVAP